MAAHFIIGSGPTREWLDPVRFISNPSTGEMGWQLGRALLDAGCRVDFISGPGKDAFRQLEGANNHLVETTNDMLQAVLSCLDHRRNLVMAAAPVDFRPADTSEHKIKKETSDDSLNVHFTKNPDILKEAGSYCRQNNLTDCLRFGFAAETKDLAENGQRKLKAKDLEMIFVNHVHRDKSGFGANPNSYLVIDRQGHSYETELADKARLSRWLADRMLEHLEWLQSKSG